MSQWKIYNDGWCSRCGVNTRLYQASDYIKEGKGSRSKAWNCPKCIKYKYGVEVPAE